MPIENIQDWSTIAADNASSDGGIDWAEGQPRASVNNSARSMMAAHAKDRNLHNGSIVTAGTANAQTFSSGYTPVFTTIPTGFRVTLRIGAGLTNTDTVTLGMDGIAPTVVYDFRGLPVGAGALSSGVYTDFIYNGTNWLTSGFQQPSVPVAGRLTVSNPSLLQYNPFNGNLIKINGVIYPIPTSGIAGLGNNNIFLNGTAGSHLDPVATYWVYAFVNSGIVTADFWTQAAGGNVHQSSGKPGNEGVEILQGVSDTRTLIGLCHTDAAVNFSDFNTLSWFNRRRKRATIALSGSTGSTGPAGIAAIAIGFVNWSDDLPFFTYGCQAYVTAGIGNFSIFIGSPTDTVSQAFVYTNTPADAIELSNFYPIAEGFHGVSVAGYVLSGGATITLFNGELTTSVLG